MVPRPDTATSALRKYTGEEGKEKGVSSGLLLIPPLFPSFYSLPFSLKARTKAVLTWLPNRCRNSADEEENKGEERDDGSRGGGAHGKEG